MNKREQTYGTNSFFSCKEGVKRLYFCFLPSAFSNPVLYASEYLVANRICLNTATGSGISNGLVLPIYQQYKMLGALETNVYFYHPDHLGSSNWITLAKTKHIKRK